jgi:hypothetical protein
MNTEDPFDRVRKSNPIDPSTLPGAPPGLANRITSEVNRRRFRLTGPALGLASMAFVLVVGMLTALIMLSGSDETVVTQASITTIESAATPSTAPIESSSTTVPPEGSRVTAGGAAPWSGEPLPQPVIPQLLINDWAKAANRTWCSALYPEDPAALNPSGISRSADFSGGWAVAWDLPNGPGREAADGYCADCGRGAYGVAGPDFSGSVDDLNIWPNQLAWEDGSRAGYGLEGLESAGSGAPWLGYLVINGQGCMYNVWSFLGEEHLLMLVDSLRFVEGMQAEPVELVDRAHQSTREMGQAPWDQTALPAASVPEAFFDEWNEDLGSTVCPLVALADLGPEGDGAVPRRGTGALELLVAWDLPDGPGMYGSGQYCADCGRGAFGMSMSRQGDERDPRTNGNPSFRFEDGSAVWVFPESNFPLPDDRFVHTDPESGLPAPEAYRGIIENAGQTDCVYQVWSSYGPEHVEYLVSQLRFVER